MIFTYRILKKLEDGLEHSHGRTSHMDFKKTLTSQNTDIRAKRSASKHCEMQNLTCDPWVTKAVTIQNNAKCDLEGVGDVQSTRFA